MAYTTINKQTSYFNTATYQGNDSASHAITGLGFQPDLTIIKNRSQTADHQWQDSVRGKTGSNYKYIQSTGNAAETAQGDNDGLNTFGTDGFTIGFTNSGGWNRNPDNFCSWSWKAGTTSGITTDGETDITPTSYSFNATSGFSIVKYTGAGNSGDGVAHGLGAKPKFFMVKRIDDTGSWQVFTQPQLNTSNATKYLILNGTAAEATNNNRWNGWQPDATNIYLGNSAEVNANGGTYVAYVFVEKTGYSKFSSYAGNGNTNGNFVYCGFAPSFVMVRRFDNSGEWLMYDNKRDPFNVRDTRLELQGDFADSTSSGKSLDFLSNGFKIRGGDGDINTNGGTYYFYAFGQTLVGTNNIPCNAR